MEQTTKGAEMSTTKMQLPTPVRRIGNPDEVGVMTYSSPTADYAEVRYPDGFHFRTRRSEWQTDAEAFASWAAAENELATQADVERFIDPADAHGVTGLNDEEESR